MRDFIVVILFILQFALTIVSGLMLRFSEWFYCLTTDKFSKLITYIEFPEWRDK